MEPLVGLALLAGGGLYMARQQKKKQPFVDVQVSPDIVKAIRAASGPDQSVAYNNFVTKGAEQNNPLMDISDPKNLPGVNKYPNKDDIRKVDEKIDLVFTKPVIQPGTEPFLNMNFQPTSTAETGQLNANSADFAKMIQVCEDIKTVDCDAFDSNVFAKKCGICVDEGIDSDLKPHVGGLYLTDISKKEAETTAAMMKSRHVNYKPTIGKCKPNRFATNKQQCLHLKKLVECEKKRNFDVEGCSMCVQDEKFFYVEPEAEAVKSGLFLKGAGLGSVTYANGKTSEQFDLSNGWAVNDALNANDIITIRVMPDNEGKTPFVAGFLSGKTFNSGAGGAFKQDIHRLIMTDKETGAKPASSGSLNVDGVPCKVMRPARGKSAMMLELYNPFYFIDPSDPIFINEPEAAKCDIGPVIKTSTAAQRYDSGVCYKKPNGPGKFTDDCLQDLWISAGCTPEGKGYPNNDTNRRALMYDQNGVARSLADLSDYLYNQSAIAYTGRNSGGSMLPIEEWDKISMYFLGKSRKTPCDVEEKDTGPLPQTCLQYIWNELALCDPEGTLYPKSEAAVSMAQKMGGVEKVKQFYKSLYEIANNNNLGDDERKNVIERCYGVNYVNREGAFVNKKSASAIPYETIFVLGPYNMAPWGVSSNFPDKDAQWISAYEGSDKWSHDMRSDFYKGPWGKVLSVTFVKEYINPTQNSIDAQLIYMIDNRGFVYMDDKLLVNDVGGGWGGDWPRNTLDIKITPGKHVFRVIQANDGGPEGMLITVIDKATKRPLFHTDSSWKVLADQKNTLDDSSVDRTVDTYLPFGLKGQSIRATTANICADIEGASQAPNSRLMTYKCHGGGNQSFTMNEDGQIIVELGGNCLEVQELANSSIGNNNAVVQNKCNKSNPRQKWSYDPMTQSLRPEFKVTDPKNPNASNKGAWCLDTNGPLGPSGKTMIVYPCHGGANQRFIAGQSYSSANTVLVGPNPLKVGREKVVLRDIFLNNSYTLEFTIKPVGYNPQWANIYRFTSTNANCCNFNGSAVDRINAMWFWPGDTRIHLVIADPRDGNFNLNSNERLPLGRDSVIKVVVNGDTMQLYINGNLSDQRSLAQSNARRFKGRCNFACSDNMHEPVNASIRNFTLKNDVQSYVDGQGFNPWI